MKNENKIISRFQDENTAKVLSNVEGAFDIRKDDVISEEIREVYFDDAEANITLIGEDETTYIYDYDEVRYADKEIISFDDGLSLVII